ncbi:hypothetical protein PZA11_003846 [Diplocarpon coronariae]|uniref:Uncharacterized protein n=1 Tax=Diplocarpon coronariae TaxID=2795749 RepID=A0A218ZBZ8_9HELO|nr:hypothetical protein JHW43_007882 [Diplocarpon mali]OWP05120.1 hypothetical protein B2J93_5638 [Marssonina coronariae]
MSFPTSLPPFFSGKFSFITRTSPTSGSVSSQTSVHQGSVTVTSISLSYTSSATPSGSPHPHKEGLLGRLESGTKVGMGIGITVGVLAIILFSAWYCCGCCGLRARGRKRHAEATRVPELNNQQPVPLSRIENRDSGTAGAAPPLYEEAVPPRHRHIAGGATYLSEEEEGVISDGKTPLSEFPFEDVVLDPSPPDGSSMSFRDRHHGLGGDTRGHTNA